MNDYIFLWFLLILSFSLSFLLKSQEGLKTRIPGRDATGVLIQNFMADGVVTGKTPEVARHINWIKDRVIDQLNNANGKSNMDIKGVEDCLNEANRLKDSANAGVIFLKGVMEELRTPQRQIVPKNRDSYNQATNTLNEINPIISQINDRLNYVRNYQPPATFAPATMPPETMPPATMPPETMPPATMPPATFAPATMPPATFPPATMPPATFAPATMPPGTVILPAANLSYTSYATSPYISGNQLVAIKPGEEYILNTIKEHALIDAKVAKEKADEDIQAQAVEAAAAAEAAAKKKAEDEANAAEAARTAKIYAEAAAAAKAQLEQANAKAASDAAAVRAASTKAASDAAKAAKAKSAAEAASAKAMIDKKAADDAENAKTNAESAKKIAESSAAKAREDSDTKNNSDVLAAKALEEVSKTKKLADSTKNEANNIAKYVEDSSARIITPSNTSLTMPVSYKSTNIPGSNISPYTYNEDEYEDEEAYEDEEFIPPYQPPNTNPMPNITFPQYQPPTPNTNQQLGFAAYQTPNPKQNLAFAAYQTPKYVSPSTLFDSPYESNVVYSRDTDDDSFYDYYADKNIVKLVGTPSDYVSRHPPDEDNSPIDQEIDKTKRSLEYFLKVSDI